MRYKYVAFLGLMMSIMVSVCGQIRPYAALPFELIGHHIFIQLQVNNSQTLEFVFDTGASTTIVDAATANHLRLPDDLHAIATGTSGEVAVSMSLDNELKINGLYLQDIRLVKTSLEHLSRYIGKRIDGILGYDLLRRYTVQINMEDRQLYIFEADTYMPSMDAEVVDFELELNIPVIEASLEIKDGVHYSGRFLIDTGAGSALILNSPFVSDENLLDRIRPSYPNRSYGLSNRSTESYIGRIANFQFGDHVFEELPVKLSTAYQGVEAMDNFMGIIGNEFLQKFTLTFDYYNQLIYFTPSASLYEPIDVNCSGLKLQMDKSLTHTEIIEVIANSPADKIGLRPGDQILRINGKSTRGLPLYIIQRYLQGVGRQIELQVDRNGEVLRRRMILKPLI